MKLLGAAGLAILALFMLLGFLNSDAALQAPASLAALAATPEAAASTFEVAGEAAGGVFTVIVEIVGGIFESR